MPTCDAIGCTTEVKKAKYCRRHYRIAWRHGDANRYTDPNYAGRALRGSWKGVECSDKECSAEAKIKGLCGRHYSRNMSRKYSARQSAISLS